MIAQDAKSGEVLMCAYMDSEAYSLTKNTGLAHYFSRSKNRIWRKGEESGNIQKVEQMILDCDADTLLLKIEQIGAACHTGRRSCFFNAVDSNTPLSDPVETMDEKYNAFDTLYHIIEERKNASPDESYTAKLFSKGENTILKKVSEEAGEFCFAVKDKNPEDIVAECADLVYHVSVALAYSGVSMKRVEDKIRSRFGMSGLVEKRNRKQE